MKVDQLVAVLTLTKSLDETPWLGQVKKVKGSTLKLCLEGDYETEWRPAIVKGGRTLRSVDTVATETVILGGFKLTKQNKPTPNVTKLLKTSYSSYFILFDY